MAVKARYRYFYWLNTGFKTIIEANLCQPATFLQPYLRIIRFNDESPTSIFVISLLKHWFLDDYTTLAFSAYYVFDICEHTNLRLCLYMYMCIRSYEYHLLPLRVFTYSQTSIRVLLIWFDFSNTNDC